MDHVKQIAQPEYTARTILKLNGNDALVVVRELGFANVAMVSDAFVAVVLLISFGGLIR
jgi:hypothetical protein